MWKKLMKRKIQRLLKGSFPPSLGGVLFSNAKKEPKRLNRFTLLRSNSFAISKPTHPSKVCFFIPSAMLTKVPLPFRKLHFSKHCRSGNMTQIKIHSHFENTF